MNITSLIDKNKKTILSLDLDNTIVNRKKGDNYVLPALKKALERIMKSESIIPVINTGRDIIGYRAFQREVLDIGDAVLGSGTLIVHDNTIDLNEKGFIDVVCIEILENAVKKGKLPFIDITHAEGRIIVYNEQEVKDLNAEDLFYSQTPRTWFETKQPITKINDYIRPKHIFRIEIPVFKDHIENLYNELVNKSDDALVDLNKFLHSEIDIRKFVLNRKVFFNDSFQGRVIFGRFQKSESEMNKGFGLQKWLASKEFTPLDFNIFHIGDKDKGLVNDVLIKDHVPNAHIIMVNSRTKNNPAVSLYLEGDTDKSIVEFITSIVEAYV